MKILIIGGTGVISTEVCNLAVEKKYDVYMVNRGKRKSNFNSSAKLIIADIRKETVEKLREKIGEITYDVVVDFLSYNVSQLKKMLKIVKCNQYVFVSSATIYDECAIDHLYVENDLKGNRNWEYCKNKYECELELINKASIYGINYTIVRPYVTYNKNRFPYQISPIEYYTIVDRIIRERPIALCNNSYTTITDSRDFAIGMVGLFGNRKAYDEDFHITTDYISNWRCIASLLANKFNTKARIVEIEKSKIKYFSNSIIDINEILYDKSRDMKFDNSKIENVVPDFEAKRRIEDSIEDIYTYFKDNMNNLRINYLWAGCLDRLLEPYAGRRSGKYNFKNIKDKIQYEIGYSSVLSGVFLLLKKMKRLFRG